MNFLYIVIVLLIIFGSVVLHELSHGLTAYWLGDHTAKDAGRLTLNPIKHIDPVMSILVPVVLYMLNAPVFGAAKPVPIDTRNLKWKEWGMALVAAAGPLANFFLSFIFFLIGHFSGALYGTGGETLMFTFQEIVFINLGFMIFNLLPIPPLDGSRILYAFSPDFFRNIFEQAEKYGLVIVCILVVFCSEIISHIMLGAMNGLLNFFYWIVGA